MRKSTSPLWVYQISKLWHSNAVRAAMLAILAAAVVTASFNAEAFEIDEFVDNRDGSATLHITCADGKKIQVKFKDRKKLDRIKVDELYNHIWETCEKTR